MAVLKHISVKGSNGGDALDYVMYKHDEMTGEMITDGKGNPIMRDEFYLDGINCEPYSYAAECREVNELYGKNQKPEDIKAHHFIVSYDPKDVDDHSLTGPKAQEISMEFANRCFPGFQMLVCTHMDGSNESGNIHTHIMMNSVRKYDTDPESFGEREIDHKAGYKLHLTEGYLRYMKQELMGLCERAELHQVDLLSPAAEKITDREYRVKQHGQERLNNMNERKGHDGVDLDKTVFQTQKQYLREAVKKVAPRATNFDEFCAIIKEEYNITVKESRGRISYLHPDREKYITDRALGRVYEKGAVLNEIMIKHSLYRVGNSPVDQELIIPQTPKTIEDCHTVFVMKTDLRLVVRLQDYAKAKENMAYARKVLIGNVKAMATTILFVQQNGFNTEEELNNALTVAIGKCNRIEKEILDEKALLNSLNEDIHFLGQYLANKKVYGSFIQSKNKTMYSKKYSKELEAYREATRFLNQKYGKEKLPVMKELREKKSIAQKRLDGLQAQGKTAQEEKKTLKTAVQNVRLYLKKEQEIPRDNAF